MKKNTILSIILIAIFILILLPLIIVLSQDDNDKLKIDKENISIRNQDEILEIKNNITNQTGIENEKQSPKINNNDYFVKNESQEYSKENQISYDSPEVDNDSSSKKNKEEEEEIEKETENDNKKSEEEFIPDYSLCYKGIELSNNFQAFSDNSPWNTPIENSPIIDPNSDVMMQTLKESLNKSTGSVIIRRSIKGWSIPIHVIDSKNCPTNTIIASKEDFHESVDPDLNGVVEDIPMPSQAWSAQEDDSHMVLIDEETRTAYEFSRFEKINSTHSKASNFAIWDLDSIGYQKPFEGKHWWKFGVNGGGVPFSAGVIKYTEMKSGVINHALTLALPTNRLKSNEEDDLKQELCSPVAARSDGWGIGKNYILEGARIQLNPDLDLDSLDLSDEVKIVARALQTYGGYSVYNSRDFTVAFQNIDKDGSGDTWKEEFHNLNLHKIPIDEFRILNCDNVEMR